MTVIRLESRNMGATMALFSLTLVLLIIGSNASGEFSVLHSPESLKFSGSSKLKESLLKEIFSASFGLSVDQDSDWNGLSIVDPFNTPEAIVEVHIEGVSNLGSAVESIAKNYHIIDDYSPDTFSIVSYRIAQHFNNGGNLITNIKLSEPEEFQSYFNVFGEVVPPKVSKQSLHHLKVNIDEDFQFLSELEALKAFVNKVKGGAVNADNTIDFFYFRFQSLHTLSDFHGPNSLQTKEAKKLLGETLKDLSDAFVKAYDGSVLVAVVCSDVAHTRRAVRAAPEFELVEDLNPGRAGPSPPPGPAGSSKSSGEQNDAYSGDYAAIFNIILWFGVVFSFTLVAIVYAIMDMDPGRDSIIYRMTSTRMKKDN